MNKYDALMEQSDQGWCPECGTFFEQGEGQSAICGDCLSALAGMYEEGQDDGS